MSEKTLRPGTAVPPPTFVAGAGWCEGHMGPARQAGSASGPTWRAAQAKATEAERRRCAEVIEAWNERIIVRRNPDPSPAIGVALTAGYRWLILYCPACRQESHVELAALDRHPQSAVTSLITPHACK